MGCWRSSRYSEKRVNEILVRFHDDTAALRRGMIDLKLMARANGEYWRIDAAVAGDPVV